MKHITIEPHIQQMLWTPNAGFHYVYVMRNAPWVHPRMAFDCPLPEHWEAWRLSVESQHQPVTFQAGTNRLVLTPRADFLGVHVPIVGVATFTSTVGYYAPKSDLPQHRITTTHNHSTDWLELHESHRASIETQIPPMLDEPLNGPTIHAYGHGPLNPEP